MKVVRIQGINTARETLRSLMPTLDLVVLIKVINLPSPRPSGLALQVECLPLNELAFSGSGSTIPAPGPAKADDDGARAEVVDAATCLSPAAAPAPPDTTLRGGNGTDIIPPPPLANPLPFTLHIPVHQLPGPPEIETEVACHEAGERVLRLQIWMRARCWGLGG